MDKLDPAKAPAVKARRKPATKSVIEATASTPMPVVAPVPPKPVAAPIAAAKPDAAKPVVAPKPVAPVAPAFPALVAAAIAAPVSPSAPAVAPDSPPPAAATPAAPPAAVPAEPAKETTMNTITSTFENTTEKAQAAFGDINERAKGAMEKGTKYAEDLAAFGKGNVEAIVESSKIAAKGLETMGQDAAAYAKQSFEQSTAALKQLATVKSPTEFLKLQGDLMRQSFDQMVAHSSRSTESFLKLAGEVAQPLSNRVAVAAEKLKVAA